MGNRYLEIFQGKRSDYYAAVASQHHHWHASGGSLDNNGSIEGQCGDKLVAGTIPRQDDAPTGAGECVQSFTPDGTAWRKSGSPLPPQSLGMQKGRGPVGNGGTSYRVRGNHGGRGGNHGGRGYKGHHRSSGHHGGGTREGPHTGFIRMRGLPFQATKQDVLDFFKDYKPIESSILLTYRVDGRATGEGYVVFDDAADAKAAMTMHRSMIGSRYIELFISNKEEHTRNVARSNPR